MNDQVRHLAALLCSHCTVTFAIALDVAIDVLVDVELPLAVRSVTVEALNVREQPGVDDKGNPVGKFVASIAFGRVVEVWCERDGWSFVVWDNNGGWCDARYLE